MALQLFKIADTTVGSPVNTISFSNIPSGYTDLKVVFSLRNDVASPQGTCNIRFNSDTGNNYTYRRLYGNGSSAASDTGAATNNLAFTFLVGATATSNTFSNWELYIPNYTSSNYKSMSFDAAHETNSTTAYLTMYAALWSNSSAISSIVCETFGQNFVTNTTVTLYGVL